MLMRLFERLVAKQVPEVTLDDVRRDVQRGHDEIGEKIAGRFTRGNTSIQRGSFLTRADLDRRAKARQHVHQ